MSGPELFRQGDVLLIPAPNAEITDAHVEQPPERRVLVLARGEQTGHAHAIHGADVHLYVAPSQRDALLVVDRAAVLRHEEHAPILVPPGRYLVRRQREYLPDAWSLVAD